MESVLIRPENSSDYEYIHRVTATAFGSEAEADLIDALRKSSAFVPELSLVAEKDGKVVGHILFSKIAVGAQQHEGLALAPMAVEPELQRQGIGSMLVKAGIAKARELDFRFVVVLGHPDYYPKFGFVPAGTYHITTKYNAPEVTFVLALTPDGLANVSGEVMYPPEFDTVS